MGRGCVLSHAAHSTEAYCLIPFLTVRFTLWTNKGSTETAMKWGGGGGGGGGGFQGPPPLYEALISKSIVAA